MWAIQQLLDSKAKIALLESIIDSQNNYTISDLSRLGSVPKSTVSGVINSWERIGLVQSEMHGRKKLVSVNEKCYFLPELRKIFRKAKNALNPVLGRIKSMGTLKKKEVRAVVAFGARIIGNYTADSDLDVLIALDDKDNDLANNLVEDFVKISAKIGVRCSPLILSKTEIKARMDENDLLIKNILSGGKIIKGGDWLDHLQAT